MTRKLKVLMPEVLPDPTPATGPGGPRDRTLQRLRGLLALTAAGASLTACSHESSEGASKTAKSSAPSAASAAPQVATSDPGYGVVDPMPTPARCYQFGQHVRASARWMDSTTLELQLSKPTFPKAKYGSSAPAVLVDRTGESEAIKSQTLTATGLRVLIHLTQGGASSVTLSVTVDCDAVPGAFIVMLTGKGSMPLHYGQPVSVLIDGNAVAGK